MTLISDAVLDEVARALIPRLDALLVRESVELGVPAPKPTVRAPRSRVQHFTSCPSCGSAVLEEAPT